MNTASQVLALKQQDGWEYWIAHTPRTVSCSAKNGPPPPTGGNTEAQRRPSPHLRYLYLAARVAACVTSTPGACSSKGGGDGGEEPPESPCLKLSLSGPLVPLVPNDPASATENNHDYTKDKTLTMALLDLPDGKNNGDESRKFDAADRDQNTKIPPQNSWRQKGTERGRTKPNLIREAKPRKAPARKGEKDAT